MLFSRYVPGAPLAGYIDSIIYLEGNNRGSSVPKRNMSLVFNLGGDFRQSFSADFSDHKVYKKYWVAGLHLRPTFVDCLGESRMVAVQFKPFGAFPFLDEPLHYFTGSYTCLSDLFKRDADETWEKLQEATDIAKKIRITEQFLLRRLLSGRNADSRITTVANSLLMLDAAARVEDVCRSLGHSRKHLNYLYKEYIGVSPKTASQLQRFQKLLRSLSALDDERLTDLAYEYDYFDQAHFSNDFKRFSGLRPSEYLARARHSSVIKIAPHYLDSSTSR